MVAARLDSAKYDVKPFVGIVLVQADLKVRRLVVIEEIHRAPFDVKDAIRCGARHRSKDPAARCEVCTTFAYYTGVKVRPSKNGVVEWAYISRRRQTSCHVAAWLVDTHEIEAPIRTDIHTVVGLIV